MDVRFPVGLESSLFLPVLVGVLCTFLSTEALGWTFTGLVVPGYLASVALLVPQAAGLMVVEALLTLLALRALGDGAAALGVGTRLFGRERFFLTLVCATGVRLAVETFLLPLLETHTRAFSRFGMEVRDAHSIGLVLVPLMAHTLDKVGLKRGLPQLAVLATITGVLVEGLLRTTNLTLSDPSAFFRDVSYTVHQNPGAYVVLLSGAFLAARANVAFGWDFHGIVVPGLLAVAWFHPTKVVATLGEAVVALGVAHLALRLPWLRRARVEGPRRLVLVFVADAVVKYSVALALGQPTLLVQATDVYGFGYLLPTLLAVKIGQRHSIGRVLWPAAQVSLGGFLLGNALLFLLVRMAAWAAPAPHETAVEAPRAIPYERAIVLGRAYVASTDTPRPPRPILSRWAAALRRFADGAPPSEAFRGLGPAVQVSPLSDEPGGVVVAEALLPHREPMGLGLLTLRAHGQRVVVGVPHPLEGETVLAAVVVARALDARAVVIAGHPGKGRLPRWASPPSSYELARRSLSSDLWVELQVDPMAPPGGLLRVNEKHWPAVLDSQRLVALVPDLRFQFSTGRGGVVLGAPEDTLRDLARRPCLATEPLTSEEILHAIPTRDDDLSWAEQRVYADWVLAPLLRAARLGRDIRPSSACRVAEALGLRVSVRVDGAGDLHALVLPGTRRGPVLLVRSGPATEFELALGVPRARAEPASARVAFRLYQASHARALILAMTSPGLAGGYATALDSLANELGSALVSVEVQKGDLGATPNEQAARLSLDEGRGSPPGLPAWLATLENALEESGLSLGGDDREAAPRFHGRLGSSDYRPGLPARRATLVLAEAVRGQGFASHTLRRLSGAGIPMEKEVLDTALRHVLSDASCLSVPENVFALARRFVAVRHSMDLRRLRELAGAHGARVVEDTVTKEAFLVVGSRCETHTALGIVSLGDRGERDLLTWREDTPLDAKALARLRYGGVNALWAPRLPAQAIWP